MRWVVDGTSPTQELPWRSCSSSNATLLFAKAGREVRNFGSLLEAYLLKTNLCNVTVYSCTCRTGLPELETSQHRPNTSALALGSRVNEHP